MASPTIASTGASSETASGTTHTINYPATVNAGDLLISIISGDNAAVSFSSPTDDNVELFDTEHSDGAMNFACYYKTAVGDEDSGSFTVTSAGDDQSTSKCWAIAGASTVQAPEESTVAEGASANPDASSVTPTGGSKDYLFLWCAGWDQKDTMSVFPTGYSSTGYYNFSGGATGCSIGWGFKAATASSDDPSAATKSGSEQWLCRVIAIHPIPGGIPVIMHHYQNLRT